MGALCSSCFKGISDNDVTHLTPSASVRRQQQLEAAEQRRRENESRGIKNPENVKRQAKLAAEKEQRERDAEKMGGQPTLKWQAD